jgi:hypothetical protein
VRRHLILALAGLGLTALLAAAVHAKDPLSDLLDDKPTCGKFGTTIDFVATPKEAAELAKKGEKLVFVLHVSGNFETPDFT